MLIYAYNALFIALCHLGLALFVLFRHPNRRLSHWFILLCVSVFCWSFGLFKHTSASTIEQAQFWDLFLHLSAIFIPWTFAHFCFEFTQKKRNLIVNLIDASTGILFLVFYLQPSFFIYEITDKPHFNFFPTARLGYVFYTGGFFTIMIYLMTEFWKYYRRTPSILHKEQAKYFLTGLIIAFIGASTNFFAVFFRSVYPLGCYLAGMFAFMVGYAIVKHRLMDIDIFLRRGALYLGVFLLLIIPSFLLMSYFQNILFGRTSGLFSFAMALILVGFGWGFYKLNQLIEPKLVQLSAGRGYNYESVVKRINYGISHYSNLDELLSYFTRLIADTLLVDQVCLARNIKGKFKLHLKSAIVNGKLKSNYKELLREENFSLFGSKNGIVIKEDLFLDKSKSNLIHLMDKTGVEVMVPVYYEDKLEAVLILGRKEKKKLFSKQDIDLLKVFSLNVGIILNNESYKVIESLNTHLKEKTENLEKAMAELKNTQLQLIHSAKLASVGELAAGVAHELNNALNASISSTRDLKEIAEEDDQLKSLSKYEVIKDDLRILNNGMTRAYNVVKSLLTFSKKNAEGFKPDNIHEGIESTLQMLNNELKDRIKVHKEFCSVNEIYCDLNQLNQVFLNVIKNSSDAIKEEGNIWIKTWVDKGNFLISIKDDGGGIEKEKLGNIFDPFFTTKEVGKGTGLGLSISHNIVRDHQGSIQCYSEVGKGTEFVISLPIDFSRENKEAV